MTTLGPDPARTVAVILGASEFPKDRTLMANPAFAESAAGMDAYFTSSEPGGMGLPENHVLNLFDSNALPDEQLAKVSDFLGARKGVANDLLLYYVGHGAFADPGRSEDYYLAVRRTESERVHTVLEAKRLARTVLPRFTYGHRLYFVLDACYAGAAVEHFQGPVHTLAMDRVRRAFREEGDVADAGSTLLVASSKDAYALAPPGERYTRFTDALLTVLLNGDDRLPPRMTLAEVGDGVIQVLAAHDPSDPRPEVHSPRQDKGDVARVPIFPNPATYNRAPGHEPTRIANLHELSYVSLRASEPEAGRAGPIPTPESAAQAPVLVGRSSSERHHFKATAAEREDPSAQGHGSRKKARLGYAMAVGALVVVSGILLARAGGHHPDGHIRINAMPSDATILVDGVKVADQSPFVLQQPAGSHRVSVTRPGFDQQDRDVEVRDGKIATLSVTLDPAADTGVSLSSVPRGGLIWVDDMAVMGPSGQAATDYQVTRLGPGQHTLEVRKPGYEPWHLDVDIQPGQLKSVQALLRPVPPTEVAKAASPPPATRVKPDEVAHAVPPSTGGINLVVDPPVGSVFLDGTQVRGMDRLGLTFLRKVPAGRHVLEVRRAAGYQNWTEEVSVASGQVTSAKAELIGPGGLTAAQRREVRLLYEEATHAFDLRKYDDAIQKYTKVYEAVGDPPMLYDIAQAYRLSNRPSNAIHYYQRYLQRAPGASNRKYVEQVISTLKALPQKDPLGAAANETAQVSAAAASRP